MKIQTKPAKIKLGSKVKISPKKSQPMPKKGTKYA